MPAGRNMVLSLFDRCMVDFWGISRLKCMKPDTIDNPKNIGLCSFREPSEWGSPARRNWIDCKSWWVCLHILYDYISHSSISTTSYPQLSQWSLWLWPFNPVSRNCVLLRTNVNLLKRVPEQIVRLFACYTKRNVNQCILNGSVLRQLTCSTKRYERERKREREGPRERESEREASERVCTDSTVHPSYVYAKTTNAICIYIRAVS